MFCTDKEWQHCDVEKMTCVGCFYNNDKNKKEEENMRRFELISTNCYPICKLPERSTRHSGGYDFYNPQRVIIKPNEIKYVKTGVKAIFPENEILILANRSSNPKKKGLVLANGIGIVDCDYYNNMDNEGEIAFAFMNITNEDVTLEEGEKLGQGIFIQYKITDNDNSSGKRISGFGSTGK